MSRHSCWGQELLQTCKKNSLSPISKPKINNPMPTETSLPSERFLRVPTRILIYLGLYRYVISVGIVSFVLITDSLIFVVHCGAGRNRNSVVGIATGYGLDDRGVRIRAPVRSRIFSSPRLPHRLWGLHSLLSSGYRGPFLRG
jgi:hypothetical protein